MSSLQQVAVDTDEHKPSGWTGDNLLVCAVSGWEQKTQGAPHYAPSQGAVDGVALGRLDGAGTTGDEKR